MSTTIIYRMSSEVKSRAKTSKLWKYFEPVDDHFATCNMCKQKFSYRTSTSNLKKHILNKHPTIRIRESTIAQVRLIILV